MKKLCVLCCILLIALLGLSACGGPPTLEGDYSAEFLLAEVRYSFDRDGGVTLKILTGGYVAYTQTGTYAINESETEITLTFPAQDGIAAYLPEGVTVNGTYAFIRGENTIQIGKVEYTRSSQT